MTIACDAMACFMTKDLFAISSNLSILQVPGNWRIQALRIILQFPVSPVTRFIRADYPGWDRNWIPLHLFIIQGLARRFRPFITEETACISRYRWLLHQRSITNRYLLKFQLIPRSAYVFNVILRMHSTWAAQEMIVLRGEFMKGSAASHVMILIPTPLFLPVRTAILQFPTANLMLRRWIQLTWIKQAKITSIMLHVPTAMKREGLLKDY